MSDSPIGPGKLKTRPSGADGDPAFVTPTPPATAPTLAGQFSTRQWFHTLLTSYRRNWGKRLEAEATLAVGPQHFDGNVGAAARFTLDLIEMDARVEVRYKLSPRFRLTAVHDAVTQYSSASV